MVTGRAPARRPWETPPPYGAPMQWFTLLVRGFGAAGATANARAQLEADHQIRLQAAVVAQRVQRSGAPARPLEPVAGPRAA